MPSQTDGDIRSDGGRVPPWMHKALHDLCQPLTALECRLYLTMTSEEGLAAQGSAQEQIDCELQEALAECGRMMTMVRSMQRRMALQEHEVGDNEGGGDDERFTELPDKRSSNGGSVSRIGERGCRFEGQAEERADRHAMDGQ